MIPPEQLVAALERLDPRDLEVLDLSLRRRVPDDALANVMGWDAPEVARRRAAAVEHLSDDLGVQSGQDLGHVLKALLEPDTWTAVDESRWPAAQTTKSAEGAPAEPEQEARDEVSGEEAPATPAEEETPAPPEPRRRRRWQVVAIAAVSLLGLAGAGAAGAMLLGRASSDKSASQVVTRRFVPQEGGPLAAPFPSSPDVAFQYLTVHVRTRTDLFDAPDGKPKIQLQPKTEWGSPRILSVVQRRAGWLAVLAPELQNGEVGWMREGQGELGSVTWSLEANLSQRELVVQRDGRTVKRFRVAIGRKENPTPEGRFAVTDKLKVSDGGPPYGCCVLALSGHQTRLPRDWPGGDRLAVHSTDDVGGIGKPVSLGCMRLRSSEARWLIQTIPLGTPLTIRT